MRGSATELLPYWQLLSLSTVEVVTGEGEGMLLVC